MTATPRAFNAANVARFTTPTTSVTAAKPNGLATGDLWLIHHNRRRADIVETGFPDGFGVVRSALKDANQGGSLTQRLYWKIATADDVAGSGVAWEQDFSANAMTQSVAVSGVNTTPLGLDEPVYDLDGSSVTSHPVSDILFPFLGGTVIAFAAGAITATNFTPAGGWTEHSDEQQGDTSGKIISSAVFHKADTWDGSGELVGTYTSASAINALTTAVAVYDASTVDASLLHAKHTELQRAAEVQAYGLWDQQSFYSPAIARDRAVFYLMQQVYDWMLDAYNTGVPPAPPANFWDTETADLLTLATTLNTKLTAARDAYNAGDADALNGINWNG